LKEYEVFQRMNHKITIGYFADGPWAHRAFKKLIEDETIEIAFICVRYDTKDLILQNLGQTYDIDVLSAPNVNAPAFIALLRQYNADLFVSMSFNQIFKHEIIHLPSMKTINCHAGKLPFYRGRNILNWVLINDEKEFGITVHYVDEGIDTGDIIKVNNRRWEIEESFRIMKTDFKSRPVYHTKDEMIKAHFLTCFLALVIYRYVEKRLDEQYTAPEIIETLRDMNMKLENESSYIPNYIRTDLTDALHDKFGFRTDFEVISEKNIKKILKKTKK